MSLILLGVLNAQATGAGVASSYDLLETVTLSSTASEIEFTGLGSYTDYQHLQIRATLQDNTDSSNVNNYYIKLNNFTSTQYPRHAMFATGSGILASGSTGTTSGMLFFDSYVAGGSDSSNFGAAIIDILDFASTNKFTTVRAISGATKPAGQKAIGLYSGLMRDTNAVTSIQITTATNLNNTGCKFSLYGIKGV
jgi:hypothetical protein